MRQFTTLSALLRTKILSGVPAGGLDAEGFGHWLSGLVDGEGCFGLNWSVRNAGKCRPCPSAKFRLKLRADDWQVLRAVRAYWGCGTVCVHATPANPVCGLDIDRIEDQAGILIPHFDRYPLRSKKARDFATWKRGVCLLQAARGRPLTHGARGAYRYTAEEREQFDALVLILKEARRYVPLSVSELEI